MKSKIIKKQVILLFNGQQIGPLMNIEGTEREVEGFRKRMLKTLREKCSAHLVDSYKIV
jgi:hypothetical protein